MPTFYETLGVAKDAKPDDIRRAYRKLAVKYHPDRNQGDAKNDARFKEMTAAYAVLSDGDKRSKYDSEIAPKPAPNYPNAGISVDLEVTSKECRNGCEKTVVASRPVTCSDCRGAGRLSRAQSQYCVLCMGGGCNACSNTGRVSMTHCARCWGSGTDHETTQIRIEIPPGTPPHGRRKLVGRGNLWGLRGPFYIIANVRFQTRRPGLIVR